MPRFLFWNLNNRPLADTIAWLAATENVDVLMFAECSINAAAMLNTLNADGQARYHYAPCRACSKIQMYARFSDDFLPIVLETDRLTIRRMALPNRTEILLAAVHFISKLHYSVQAQEEEAGELSRTIRQAEAIVNHKQTILCGDLNMNPFEYGMVGAGKLNAVMTKEVAMRSERTIQGRNFQYFYNPMWAHFGDANGTAPGTLYYPKSDHICYYWNMFDQVLLRPELLTMWHDDRLKILTGDGTHRFLNSVDAVAEDETSDHLPIVFELEF